MSSRSLKPTDTVRLAFMKTDSFGELHLVYTTCSGASGAALLKLVTHTSEGRVKVYATVTSSTSMSMLDGPTLAVRQLELVAQQGTSDSVAGADIAVRFIRDQLPLECNDNPSMGLMWTASSADGSISRPRPHVDVTDGQVVDLMQAAPLKRVTEAEEAAARTYASKTT
eukprot:TRINITY_DN12310_c0_g2_i1.p2 TRINITY_DN12310_c0_g2~~TRINITY_DN12310_c0_g2_i1.p2  ORF type:complete len:169 (+),score=27.02 TRINITY_DN12310_c0_g2_i1:362-868(+)